MMKLRYVVLLFCWLITLISACTPKPDTIAVKFLDDLKSQRFDDAMLFASPAIQAQIAIMQADKSALYDGQDWQYSVQEAKINSQSASVKCLSKLADGTQISQVLQLKEVAGAWKVDTIKTDRIVYSAKGTKARSRRDYWNGTLITPLDITDITKEKLDKHMGRFIMVSGYLCDFKDGHSTLEMTMGKDDRIPLLHVFLKDKAKAYAIKEHAMYAHLDSMVESPRGNTFTAIGLLKTANGQPQIEVNNPRYIVIGEVLRLDLQ